MAQNEKSPKKSTNQGIFGNNWCENLLNSQPHPPFSLSIEEKPRGDISSVLLVLRAFFTPNWGCRFCQIVCTLAPTVGFLGFAFILSSTKGNKENQNSLVYPLTLKSYMEEKSHAQTNHQHWNRGKICNPSVLKNKNKKYPFSFGAFATKSIKTW